MGEIDVRTERDKSLSDDENGKMYHCVTCKKKVLHNCYKWR